MSDVIQNIYEWNKDKGLVDKTFDLDLEYEMLKEELIELIIAQDKVEVADALGDIIFVAIGSLSKLTKDEQKVRDIMDAICAANDQKKQEVNGMGKILKPENFVGPEDVIKRVLDAG
jgi:predicted HAD superfamily Cof-like phosphohydrolase